MSSIVIIVGIVVLLGALVCYAFFSQAVQQKQEQRKRLLAMLKGRMRTFKFMLNGFPKGFLSKDLTLLVNRSLAEVAEQLAKLEPNEPTHMQDFQLASSQLTDMRKQPGPHVPPKLETHQQIKEVRACLEELNKFIVRLEEKNAFAANQANAYRSQIRSLVTQVSVDGYEIHGKKAVTVNKIKLAEHYYNLALNLLIREANSSTYQERIQGLKKVLEEIRAQLAEADPSANLSQDELSHQEGVQAEWDKMNSGEDLWKKKNVYD